MSSKTRATTSSPVRLVAAALLASLLLAASFRLGALFGVTAIDGMAAFDMMAAFLVIVPGMSLVLAPTVLPAQLKSRALPFPRLQRVATWLYGLSLLAFVAAPFARGGDDVRAPMFHLAWDTEVVGAGVYVTVAAVSLAVVCAALTALKVVVALHRGRAAGHPPSVLVWTLYAKSLVVLATAPILGLAMMLLIGERTLGLSLFSAATGGDPSLFMNLFWFAAHPLLYTSALPVLGVALEVSAGLSGRRSGASATVVVASLAVAFSSMLSWGQHVPGSSGVFLLCSALFGVVGHALLVLLVGRVLSTLQGGRILAQSPLWFALAAAAMGTVFAWFGVAAAPHHLAPWFDLALFGRFGIDLLVAMNLFAGAAAILYWWPQRTGATADEAGARRAFGFLAVGTLTFMVGDLAGPWATAADVMDPTRLALRGTGVVLFVVGAALFAKALRDARPEAGADETSANPWRALGLEWPAAERAPAAE